MSYISVITPCYNEELNIPEVYRQVKAVFDELKEYQYEHIFIDNASKDNTASGTELVPALYLAPPAAVSPASARLSENAAATRRDVRARRGARA